MTDARRDGKRTMTVLSITLMAVGMCILGMASFSSKNVEQKRRYLAVKRQSQNKAASLSENSPGDRDGRKLSIDETKEILLEILNGPEGFRALKRIAAKMDEDVDGDAEGDAEQSRRLDHHLTVHFPDCVLLNEAECKEAILTDLESSPDLYAHIGGYVEFDTRKKRSPDPHDPDHDKVVLVTDSTGTKVIGLNGDCIVHYPFKWLKDGVEIAIGPWDCSLGQHPEELQYCNPLGPDECCEMIQASIGHETDDHGHHLECYVQKQEEPDMQKVVIVVDEVDGQDIVVEDAVPKLSG